MVFHINLVDMIHKIYSQPHIHMMSFCITSRDSLQKYHLGCLFIPSDNQKTFSYRYVIEEFTHANFQNLFDLIFYIRSLI